MASLLDRLATATGYVVVGDPLPGPDDDDATVRDIPGYCQIETFTCGFVAGLMVLHTFKPRASIDRFYSRVNPHPDWGTSTAKLAAALRKSGIGVSHKKNLDFDAVADAIEDGYPVITCVEAHEEYDHWVGGALRRRPQASPRFPSRQRLALPVQQDPPPCS